jgi:hypothetical protein
MEKAEMCFHGRTAGIWQIANTSRKAEEIATMSTIVFQFSFHQIV